MGYYRDRDYLKPILSLSGFESIRVAGQFTTTQVCASIMTIAYRLVDHANQKQLDAGVHLTFHTVVGCAKSDRLRLIWT